MCEKTDTTPKAKTCKCTDVCRVEEKKAKKSLVIPSEKSEHLPLSA